MNIALAIVVVVVLVGLGGLMAASESALGVLSATDLLDAADQRRARRSLTAMGRDIAGYRTVASFVRILSETASAVFITAILLLSTMPTWLSLLLAVLIMSAASFVLAGSSPRSVGRAHPVGVLSVSAPIIHILKVFLGPLARLLIAIGDRVTPGRPGLTAFSSEEQLLSMVDEAAKHDVIESDERELIHSVFEFGETVAREVMIPRVDMVTVESRTSLKECLDVFFETGHSRLPVTGEDNDDVAGILNLRDVARLASQDGPRFAKKQASDLIRPVIFVPESKKADETLRELQLNAQHMALVVDEHGGIAGLLTLEDLLEELVGEIADEHDRGQLDIVPLDESSYLVSTRLQLDDLGELFGIELADEDVDSVGGLMAKELERLPKVGDSLRVSGLLFIADKRGFHRGRVTRVTVRADESLTDAQEAFHE